MIKGSDLMWATMISISWLFIYLYARYVVIPYFRRSNLNKPWEDFYHEDYRDKPGKRLVIRIFREKDEYDALEGIQPRKILEVGRLDNYYKFCLYEG